MAGDAVGEERGGDSSFGAFVPGTPCIREATGSGRLDGLTFAVKDLIDVAGTATGGGNPDWLASHAAAAARRRWSTAALAAGARLVGKTVTDELAFSLEGENAHYGTPVNPACPERLPGGSSSGSAVAVAAGLVDFALGTDTGGSVRVPASFTGVFGFRPTHGRVSTQGVVEFAPSYDTVGWFARTADVLNLVGETLLDGTPDVPLRRLVLVRDAFAMADARRRGAARGRGAPLGRRSRRPPSSTVRRPNGSNATVSCRARRSGSISDRGSRRGVPPSGLRSRRGSPMRRRSRRRP